MSYIRLPILHGDIQEVKRLVDGLISHPKKTIILSKALSQAIIHGKKQIASYLLKELNYDITDTLDNLLEIQIRGIPVNRALIYSFQNKEGVYKNFLGNLFP